MFSAHEGVSVGLLATGSSTVHNVWTWMHSGKVVTRTCCAYGVVLKATRSSPLIPPNEV